MTRCQPACQYSIEGAIRTQHANTIRILFVHIRHIHCQEANIQFECILLTVNRFEFKSVCRVPEYSPRRVESA